jgi:hypothetical protein
MNRYLAPILMGLLLTGCTRPGQAPTSDPFLVGRTRISPPPTGAANGAATDPYLSSPSSLPPAWRPSGTATAPAGAVTPPVGTATPLPASTAPPPGFTSRTPDLRGTPVPPASTLPVGASAVPSLNNRPAAAANNANFHGVSLQGSRSAVATPEFGSSTGTIANRVGPALDNRIPRPLDDAAAGGNAAGPKPTAGSGQPPAKDDASGCVMDLTDLPTAL